MATLRKMGRFFFVHHLKGSHAMCSRNTPLEMALALLEDIEDESLATALAASQASLCIGLPDADLPFTVGD